MRGPARLGGTALTSTESVTLRILLVAVKRMALSVRVVSSNSAQSEPPRRCREKARSKLTC